MEEIPAVAFADECGLDDGFLLESFGGFGFGRRVGSRLVDGGLGEFLGQVAHAFLVDGRRAFVERFEVDALEERVALEFVDVVGRAVDACAESVLGIEEEELADEVDGRVVLEVFGNLVLEVEDLVEDLVLDDAFERRRPRDHLVQDAAERPEVRAVAGQVLVQHFGRHVQRSADERVLFALVVAPRILEVEVVELFLLPRQHVVHTPRPITTDTQFLYFLFYFSLINHLRISKVS